MCLGDDVIYTINGQFNRPLIDPSVEQSIKQPIEQSIKQPIEQPIKQPIEQPIGQSYGQPRGDCPYGNLSHYLKLPYPGL